MSPFYFEIIMVTILNTTTSGARMLDSTETITKETFEQPEFVSVSVDGNSFDNWDDYLQHLENTHRAKLWGARRRDQPEENIKNKYGLAKPSLRYIPTNALAPVGEVMRQSAEGEYKPFNWRDSEVTASIFYEAILRHLIDWYSSDAIDLKSNVNHMAHIVANGLIILDSVAIGNFIDDRPSVKVSIDETLRNTATAKVCK